MESRRFTRTLAVVGLVAAALLAPASAGTETLATETGAEVAARTPRPKPVLLLIHGGGFFRGSPRSMDYAARLAATQGAFQTFQPAYPLNNLAGAFVRIKQVALQLRARGRRVYAYGDSAGGAIAAWLASRGLVLAAAAKSPPTSLVDWRSPFAVHYATAPLGDPHSWHHLRADRDVREFFSTAHRPSLRPLRIYQSCADPIVPCSINIRFARRERNVSLVRIWGAHEDPAAKAYAFADALRWLAARDRR